jgi:basic membrane protein A and related proteins
VKSSRLVKLSGLLLLVLASTLLFACAAPQAAPTQAPAPTVAPTTAPKLKVAMLFAQKIAGSAWDEIAYQGLKAIEKDMGAEIAYTENVQVADIENVLREYASKDFDLIIGNGFEFGDPMNALAKEFPKAAFVTVTGVATEPNVMSLDFAMHEIGYALGYVAGLMTESDKVGFVAGQPYPSVIRYTEGFKLGAKAANPDVDVKAIYTNSWDDAQKAREAAVALQQEGCDVIGHKVASAGQGIIKLAADNKLWAIGDGAGQIELAPDTVLTTGLTDMPALMVNLAKKVQDGKFEGGASTPGFADDVVSIGTLNKAIPADAQAKIEKMLADIKSGAIVVPQITEQTTD